VPGEGHLLDQWQAEDLATFNAIDPATYYHGVQDQDFLQAVLDDREPMVTGAEGRKVVELFAGIYRSQRTHQPVKFPLSV
jgi:predicted dehydrogenase